MSGVTTGLTSGPFTFAAGTALDIPLSAQELDERGLGLLDALPQGEYLAPQGGDRVGIHARAARASREARPSLAAMGGLPPPDPAASWREGICRGEGVSLPVGGDIGLGAALAMPSCGCSAGG